jgi:hypothetical protein
MDYIDILQTHEKIILFFFDLLPYATPRFKKHFFSKKENPLNTVLSQHNASLSLFAFYEKDLFSTKEEEEYYNVLGEAYDYVLDVIDGIQKFDPIIIEYHKEKMKNKKPF